MSGEEERNMNVVRDMLKALEREDYTALEEHPGLGETRRFHPIWQRAFKDLQYNVEQMIAEGELVATRLFMVGTHVGPFMGAAPTGKEFKIMGLQMDRVVDGKIVEHWANADWVTVLRQLDVIPPPPATKEIAV